MTTQELMEQLAKQQAMIEATRKAIDDAKRAEQDAKRKLADKALAAIKVETPQEAYDIIAEGYQLKRVFAVSLAGKDKAVGKRSKLTTEQEAELASDIVADKLTLAELADKYGISVGTVQNRKRLIA